MPISDAFDEHLAVVRASREAVLPQLERAVELIASALLTGGSCFAFGNGGSAADAQHFAAELVGHFRSPRRGLAAQALTTDSSVLTSVANDLGFDAVFSRQVDALAREGDVVLAISTSGRSPNVLEGAAAARRNGCSVVGLGAGGGGALGPLCDVLVDVPSADTQRIQEVHGLCLHLIVHGVEERLAAARDADG